MTGASGIDAEGPWFDGVEVLKQKEISVVNATQAKAKSAAPYSVTTSSMLGMIRTAYLEGGPSDYQYQDMGPMRFPESIQYAGSNETMQINDMKLTFQLAEVMNQLNKGQPNYTVNFIPWIQNSPNGLYYYSGLKGSDGLPPTATEIKNNPKYAIEISADPIVGNITDQISQVTCDPKTMGAVAKNVFKAHKAFLDTGLGGLGGDDWSEFAYFHNHLKYSLNATDQAINGGDFGGYGGNSFQVQLSWKNNYTDTTFQNKTYDYAMISAPFSKVRSWRFPNTKFNPTLKNAITAMPYDAVCKVALQFSTRFWEHYRQPIYGSCSTATDIPGIGSICYPSYKVNSTGPGVMQASYTSADFGIRFASWPELEHVQYVLNAMIEIHGEVAREQYTGKYSRKCWALDPLESASWASPSIGMHKLYIPTYFETVNNMIFVGEHTSYTHAWIASALESGIRGSVQLLLELGLVDEAKAITEKFMARWISV
ncbi:MAG: hypothetical protein Q9223_001128 [Gallowayella weberi]